MEYKHKMVFLSVILITMIFFSGIDLFASPRNVYDNAALFTESELEVLDKKAANSSEKLMIDFIIITTSDNQDKTVEDYTQDFYNQNGLGYGANKNAVIMLFDMDSEQLYVSPFSNDGSDSNDVADYSNQEFKLTYDEIRAKFGSDNFYYAAATTYMDTIESFINENDIQIVANTASQNNTASQSNADTQNDADASENMGIYLFTAIMLGGLISWLMVPKMDHTYMKDTKTTIEVGDYLENNALNIVDKQDRHINTRMAAR